jgi:DNA repair exonuclease SbcCD ATPase subunit
MGSHAIVPGGSFAPASSSVCPDPTLVHMVGVEGERQIRQMAEGVAAQLAAVIQSQLRHAEQQTQWQYKQQLEYEAQQHAAALVNMSHAKQQADRQAVELQQQLSAAYGAQQMLQQQTQAQQQQMQQQQQQLQMYQQTIQQQQQQIQQLQYTQQQLEADKQQLHQRLKLLEADKQRLEHESQPVPATTCCVCMEKVPSVLYLPCRHVKVCEGCDAQLERRDPCPVCRTPVAKRIRQLHL